MDFTMDVDNKDLDLAKRIANEYDEHYKILKTFVNSLGVCAFIKYLADCSLAADVNSSLFQYKKIYELSDIADVNFQGTTIDIRTFVNSDALYIPKKHFEQDLLPKYYVYAQFDEDRQQIIFKGYISADNINKTKCSDYYYVVDENHLSSMENLIEELYNLSPNDESLNLEDFEGTFAALCDDELDNSTQLRMVKMLYMSVAASKSFMNFVKFDMLAKQFSDFDNQSQNDDLEELVTQDVLEENIADSIENNNIEHSETSVGVIPVPIIAPVMPTLNVDMPNISLGDIENTNNEIDNINDSTSLDELSQENEDVDFLEEVSQDENTFEDNDVNQTFESTFEDLVQADENEDALMNEESDINFDNQDDEGIDFSENDNFEELSDEDNNIFEEENQNTDDELEEPTVQDELQEDIFATDDDSIDILDEDENGVLLTNDEEQNLDSTLEDIQSNLEQENIGDNEEISDNNLEEVLDDNIDYLDLDTLQENTTEENENNFLEEDTQLEIVAENSDAEFTELQLETFEEDNMQTNELSEDEEEFFEDAPTQVFDENFESDANSDLDTLEGAAQNNEIDQDDDEEFFEDAPTQVFEENLESDLDSLQDDDLFDIVEDDEQPEIVENNELTAEQDIAQTSEQPVEYNADEISDLLNELEQSNETQDSNNNVNTQPLSAANNTSEEIQTLFEEPKQGLTSEGDDLSDTEYSMYVEQPKQTKSKKIIVPLLSVCVLSGLIAGGAYYKFAHNKTQTDAVSDIQAKNIDDFDDNTFLEKAEMDAMNVNTGENELSGEDLAANPDTIKPKDINQSMTDVFDDTIYPVMISKIAWEVPENYTTSKYFKKYLQVTGVQLQRELQQNLSKVSEVSTTNKIKVSFQIYTDNSVKNLRVVETSGSGEIDEITLKSIKNTLSYVKVPVIPSSDNFVTLSMVINF